MDPARQRRAIMASMGGSAAVAVLLWWGVFALLPSGFAGHVPPLTLALQCIGIATLFTLAAGIEAVAHERLVTPAIDPLAGAESPHMKVNQRYIQNTLEQLVIFAAGLALLALYAEARVLVAATLVWVLGRWAFWIGYHIAPRFRAIGLVGMVQSLVVLVAGVGFAAYDHFGMSGAVAAVALFVVIETVVTFAAIRPKAWDDVHTNPPPPGGGGA
jgi:hypothetical protein